MELALDYRSVAFLNKIRFHS